MQTIHDMHSCFNKRLDKNVGPAHRQDGWLRDRMSFQNNVVTT